MKKKYKSRYYRTRFKIKQFHVGKKVTAVIVCVLISSILAVILGLTLGDKVKEIDFNAALEDKDLSQTQKQPHELTASYIDISNVAGGNVGELVKNKLPSTKAVSIYLNKKSAIYCSSEAINNMTKKGLNYLSCSQFISLNDLTTALHDKNRYIVGCFESSAFDLDSLDRELARVCEISFLTEISKKGIDEILIFGLPVYSEDIEETLEYLHQLKARMGDTVPVGVAIPYGFIADSSASTALIKIYSACDFLALDVSELCYDTESFENALSTAEYFIENYKMRILLAEQNPKTLQDQKSIMLSKGFSNWQVLRLEVSG